MPQASGLRKGEGELAEFAISALAKLKEMPDKLRSFFGDPALGYIGNLARPSPDQVTV
jgi:hypothetical protein